MLSTHILCNRQICLCARPHPPRRGSAPVVAHLKKILTTRQTDANPRRAQASAQTKSSCDWSLDRNSREFSNSFGGKLLCVPRNSRPRVQMHNSKTGSRLDPRDNLQKQLQKSNSALSHTQSPVVCGCFEHAWTSAT